ncbi:HAMP domain-containing histidine kinase [Patescibacteria group bacterium]|nr:HAMP domain-containing histidine kinase [Patescibacteria group bacterium]
MANLPLLKQFVESVTAFARKYKHDLFFRTELNVIVLQVLFTTLILALVAVGFSVLYKDVSTNLLVGIMTGIVASGTTTSAVIVENLEYLKDRNFVLIAAAITLTTAIFGYLLARLTLAPTRNALESQKLFIGNVAHELRTPLSIIKTNTEVTLFDETLPKDARDTLTSTVEELDRISDIINNLLSLNVLVRPEKIPFDNVDMGVVADRVLAHLAGLTERKKLTVTVERSEYATVWGNLTALEQIVMNLVKNAANYTQSEGVIKVRITPDYRGHIVTTVEDSGIGISEEDLLHIFEPFYRADSSRTRGSGGSGLGLAIVSELVKLHHGSITIKSSPGHGTSVAVTLPCGRIEKEEDNDDLQQVSVDFSKYFGPQKQDKA